MASMRIKYLITCLMGLQFSAIVCARVPLSSELQESKPEILGVSPCPSDSLIQPCTCQVVQDYEMEVDCSNVASEVDLKGIFSQTFRFSNKFKKLTISSNKQLTMLQEGDFGISTFEQIVIQNTGLRIIRDGTFAGSSDILVSLSLTNNELASFPDVSTFKDMTLLDVSGNNLVELPKISSEKLEALNIGRNLFDSFTSETFMGLPNLKTLYFDSCLLSEIPAGAFSSNTHLSLLNFDHNQLKTVPEDTIILHGEETSLSLKENQIEDLSSGSFSGVTSLLDVSSNKLTKLDENAFKPSVEAGALLYLNNNPFLCGCDVAWLILHQDYLKQLIDNPVCEDGESFRDLDPVMYRHLCPDAASAICSLC